MHTMIAFLGLNFVILLGSPKIPSKNAFLSPKWNKALFEAKINSLFFGKRRLRILMGGTKHNQCKSQLS